MHVGAVRLKAMRVLYENTEDGKLYGWTKLMELLVSNGINENYARQIIVDFTILGLLEKPKTGLYKVNRARLRVHLAKYEAKLARGGESGGPGPSQG